MVHESSLSSNRDRKVNEIISAYLEAVDAGQTPDRQEWLRRYLEFASELETFLADYEHVDRLAELLRPAGAPGVPAPPERVVSGVAATTGSHEPAGFSVGATVRYMGDYELLEEIARGGMGVVYKARQISLNRIVAVKMILAGLLATKADHDRFHAEAQAAALLDHPNILPIFEVGEYEGQHYFSMCYVDGQSLAVRLAAGPLAPREAAELAATVAGAVEYAHRQGVIHRDIKPSNVLIDCKGRPRVTDFGLAKQVGGGSDLTVEGHVLGTPSYMPPEQAAGQVNAIGPAADVYSLGALLYVMLAGRPPFQAAMSLETLRQVIESEPVALRQLDPGVPRDLETIVLKCLEKAIPRRYATAQALAEDLRRYLDGRPILARPVGRWEHAWRWCRRQPAVAGLIAAVALTLVAGILISLIYAVKTYKERDRANSNAERADKNAGEATANALTAERKAIEAEEQKNRVEDLLFRARTGEYSTQVGLAQRDLLDGDYVNAERLLDGCALDLRGWEHRYVCTELSKKIVVLKGQTSEVTSVAFSPDGRRIVAGSGDNTVRVWDVASRQVTLTLKGHTNALRCVAFSPDGRRIIAGSGDAVKVWDAATGNEQLTLKGHSSWVYSVAFSPDGRRIVSGSLDHSVKVWDAARGQEMLTLKGCSKGVLSVAFSPDGRRIVAGSWGEMNIKIWDAATGHETLTVRGLNTFTSVAFNPDGRRIIAGSGDAVKVWDAATGKETLKLKGHTNWVNSVAFSPDGQRIICSCIDGKVRVWDATTGTEMLTLHTSGMITSVAYSQDGRRIVAGIDDGTVNVLDATPGQKPLTLEGHSEGVLCVALCPDGRRIASGSRDRTVKVWDSATGKEMLTFKGHLDNVASVAFSPDGRRIVSGSRDKTVKVWDAATGKEMLTLKGHMNIVTSVAFSPDGRRIASFSRDNTVKVWDASSGQEMLMFKGDSMFNGDTMYSVAFSLDGRRIVAGGGDEVKVWDAATGKETLTFKWHSSEASSLAFSADGRRIVSASWVDKVKIWDAVSGQEMLTFKGDTKYITSVAFSPDGRRIVSGSKDKAIKVWDAVTGQETLAIEGHSGEVNSVAFSPDGWRIVSGSSDGTIKVWDAGAAEETLNQNTPRHN